ncbi:MAG: NADH-quinone oxidoreductase subunit J [Thermoanaerobaculia bacterium]|nr:NADH-quinone oxidoreductase subunit J [Thermoanaerobaculia bacterium]
MELAVFLIFGVAALVSSIVVIAHRNPVYATMSLVVTLVSTAVLFVLLGSPFLAVLQVLLYTGAILVLFLFVIMLLNLGRERGAPRRTSPQAWIVVTLALVFAGTVARLFLDGHAASTVPALRPGYVSLRAISEQLFSTYLLPFEIIGLLLLVAVVAASWVARRADDPAAGGSAEEPR